MIAGLAADLDAEGGGRAVETPVAVEVTAAVARRSREAIPRPDCEPDVFRNAEPRVELRLGDEEILAIANRYRYGPGRQLRYRRSRAACSRIGQRRQDGLRHRFRQRGLSAAEERLRAPAECASVVREPLDDGAAVRELMIAAAALRHPVAAAADKQGLVEHPAGRAADHSLYFLVEQRRLYF